MATRHRLIINSLEAPVDWGSIESSVFLNPLLPKDETNELLELATRFDRAGHIWIASSGSAKKTGESLKLMALSKDAFRSAATGANGHLMASASDVWIRVLPRFHVGGLSIEVRAALSGARSHSGFLEERWHARHFVGVVREYGGTLSALVPTQVHDLLEEGLKPPPSLRAIIVGGAALPLELYQRARQAGWPLLPSYGLTECCSQVATAELESLNELPASMPRLRVLKHCQVRTNANGFLEIAGGSLLTGFAQNLQGMPRWETPSSSGWYTSSDHARIEASSEHVFLAPLGRGQDFIKINAEGVNLSRVRERLASIVGRFAPAWHFEMVLLDVPHVRSGAELILVITKKIAGHTDLVEEIMGSYNSLSLPLERVSKVVMADDIPRSPLGKIQWDVLRRLSSKM